MLLLIPVLLLMLLIYRVDETSLPQARRLIDSLRDVTIHKRKEDSINQFILAASQPAN